MSETDASVVLSCTTNSDYAVICSFFEHFGEISGLLFPSFIDLQQMIENTEEGTLNFNHHFGGNNLLLFKLKRCSNIFTSNNPS
jgi:hypothetical protein